MKQTHKLEKKFKELIVAVIWNQNQTKTVNVLF